MRVRWNSVVRRQDADRHIEEVIALASDFSTASSADEEAVKRQPGKLITLRPFASSPAFDPRPYARTMT